MNATAQMPTLVRQRWTIIGQVQGVGFRPFVYRQARQDHLTGFIRNDSLGATMEVQGTVEDLTRFAHRFRANLPPLARVERIDEAILPCCADEEEFLIEPSRDLGTPHAAVTMDAAVCPDCVRELFDAGNRRFGYELINCTNCGPRYSIIQRVPYDRPNTTMARFEMCDACAAEYADPTDRRFHAQPIACHDCSPAVNLVNNAGRPIGGHAIRQATRRLEQGEILAIKGLGGFHLAVRADHAAAVQRLRRLKHRDAKPFALICRSLEAARRLVDLGPQAMDALRSPAAPIVLAPRRGTAPVAAAVAPNNHRLGVMLPYTPFHHLLLELLGRAAPALVLTSGNQCDEPLVIDNGEAVRRLGGLCDAILWHERPIARCVDDSVLLDMGGVQPPLPIRRSRGFVPAGLRLPQTAVRMGLCVGAELKNTIAVVRDNEAILSQHLGNLDHPLALTYFAQAIDDLCALFGVQPQWIAHDLHPAYHSTLHAAALAAALEAELIPVQHHHAHAAAVLAEHGLTGPALAVVCDGAGWGTDGTIWGGELLLADLTDFRRLASLTPLALPGGDAAAKDIRRCALAILRQTFGADFAEHPAVERLIPEAPERCILTQMLARNVNCPQSSGAGRLFDGLAALLGLAQRNDFEAQAALRVEAAAGSAPEPTGVTDGWWTLHDAAGARTQIDLSGFWRWLLEHSPGVPVEVCCRAFHDTLAAAWAAAVMQQVQRTGLRVVTLSGGVFCNQVLTQRLTELLESRGLRVLRHEKVPPNDGGVAFGQAAVAVARGARGGNRRPVKTED